MGESPTAVHGLVENGSRPRAARKLGTMVSCWLAKFAS